jgi:hypothetical protein
MPKRRLPPKALPRHGNSTNSSLKPALNNSFQLLSHFSPLCIPKLNLDIWLTGKGEYSLKENYSGHSSFVMLGRKKGGVGVWGIKARFGADASNGSLFGLSSLRVLPTLTSQTIPIKGIVLPVLTIPLFLIKVFLSCFLYYVV